jgi:outer membrane protein
MNFKTNFLGLLSLLGIIALGTYVLMHREKPRGYVMTQKVFQGFKGTVELNGRMETVRKSNKKLIDSLELLTNKAPSLLERIRQIKSEKQEQERVLAEQYTSELWSVLNKNIEEYGKEKGYEFIFGASGNGSLMYGGESMNITQDVIEYVNKKYDAK